MGWPADRDISEALVWLINQGGLKVDSEKRRCPWEACVYKLKLTEKITLTLKKQYKIQFQEKKSMAGS